MQVGPYELLDLVGKGAMGSVYRARREGVARPMALKLMAPELVSNPVLWRRFEQECAAAVAIRHPHVVEGIEFGVADGTPFLVMEFIDGETLAERVTRAGPLAPEVALRLTGEVGSALEAAHGQGLIHRDVKPENVMIDRAGRAKLADLGLVKDLDAEESLTRSGAWVGTIAYMAPEQFGDARHADARCDVYALAATLYFALTGSSPFPQNGAMTVLGKKLANDFPRPRDRLPALASAVDLALCRALDHDPERRPTSAAEFVLQTGGEMPAGAGPAPDAEPDRRGARRFPVAMGAACAPIGTDRRWMATLLDVSLTGVRLRVSRRFEPSAVLGIEVLDEAVGAALVARVRWVRPSENGSAWEVGCDFSRPLTEADLIGFVKQAATVRVKPEG